MNPAPLTIPPHLLQLRERAAQVSELAMTLHQIVHEVRLTERFECWLTETCSALADLQEKLDRVLGAAEIPPPSHAEGELIRATLRMLQHEALSLSKDFSECVAAFRLAERKGLPDPKDGDLVLAIADRILELLRLPAPGQNELDPPVDESPDNRAPLETSGRFCFPEYQEVCKNLGWADTGNWIREAACFPPLSISRRLPGVRWASSSFGI